MLINQSTNKYLLDQKKTMISTVFGQSLAIRYNITTIRKHQILSDSKTLSKIVEIMIIKQQIQDV